MKVLMLGWEFPPFISGGLGTACHGLTKGLTELGTEVVFVLPRPVESGFTTHVNLLRPRIGAEPCGSLSSRIEKLANVEFRAVDARMYPYAKEIPVDKNVNPRKHFHFYGTFSSGASLNQSQEP